MKFTMTPAQTVVATFTPIKADLTPSAAVITNVTFTAANPALYTLAQDATNPLAVSILGLGVEGSADYVISATATEADGTQHTITDTETIVLALVAPPVDAAVGFSVVYGTPTP